MRRYRLVLSIDYDVTKRCFKLGLSSSQWGSISKTPLSFEQSFAEALGLLLRAQPGTWISGPSLVQDIPIRAWSLRNRRWHGRSDGRMSQPPPEPFNGHLLGPR